VHKVLFIATVESHIINFHIPFIKYFQNKGYEVHVATQLGERRQELIDINVVLHDIGFTRCPYSPYNIKALQQLKNLMDVNKFDLVHVNTPIAAFLGRLAAKITNTKPVLYTAHGFHFYSGAPLKNWIMYYTMERLAAKWTDGLITMNEEDFIAACKLPIRCRRSIFKVHGVGIDIDKYDIKDINVRKRVRNNLGLTDDSVLILTVAEVNANKNHKQLINTIKQIETTKPIFCYIVGDGDYKLKLHNFVKQNGLETQVRFLGFRRNIPDLLSASDIFCLFSHREGLPKCIMEAMAAGKPVIASDVRGNRDLIKDGVNGLLVPINDIGATKNAILNLINNEKLSESMGLQAKEIIKDYALETVLKEMDEIYGKFL
jgi:glycosyltransferase involved in cell wall biosynthesis